MKRSEMKGKVPLTQALVTPEMKALFRFKAKQRGMSLATWVVQACLSYERRNGAKAAMAEIWHESGWRKDIPCSICEFKGDKQFHDPITTHSDIAFDDEMLEVGKLWK